MRRGRGQQAATAAAALAMLAAHAPLCSAQPAAGTPGDRPPPPTVADPIRGLDLWRGAKIGMDVDGVRRQFPGAAINDKPTTLTGGQVDLLTLGGLDLDGHAAVAHFYFSSVGLTSVELTPLDLKPGQPVRNMDAAKRIASDYAARYGRGYDCGSKGLGDVATYECKWLVGRVAIQLWYMDVAGQAPLAFVAYRQADDPSYNL